MDKDIIRNMLAKDYEIKEVSERQNDDAFMKDIICDIGSISQKVIDMFDAEYYHGVNEIIIRNDYSLYSKIRSIRTKNGENDKAIRKDLNRFIQKWSIRLDNFSIHDNINSIQNDYIKDLKALKDSLS